MNPLLVMAILAAASTAANYQGQKKVDKTRANALAEESRRRKVAGDRAAEAAQSTAQLLTGNAGQSEADKASEIEAQYAASARPVGTMPTGSTLSGFTAPPRSTLTVASDQRALDRSRADAAGVSKARAGLNAFGDVMVDRNIQAGRNASEIDRQNTNVRNWGQYVLPAQLNRANMAGQDWNTLADVLQLASAIYGPIGLSKVPGGALKSAFDVSTTSGQGGSAFAGLV